MTENIKEILKSLFFKDINLIYFLEITNCSNSNPPFMTFFEDPDPASFVYTIEEYPSNIGNSL